MKSLLPLLFAVAAPSLAWAVDNGAVPRPPAVVGWGQWAGALLVVLAALAVFFLALRRFSGMAGLGSRHLKVLAGVSLGARERVVLLQTGNKQLVLGVCPGRIQTLCVLEGEDRVPVEPAAPASAAVAEGAGFSSVLNSLLQR